MGVQQYFRRLPLLRHIDILVIWKSSDRETLYNTEPEERMKQINLTRTALLLLVLVGMTSMGFQCSSPNITSGKLYLQQYQSSKNKEKLEKAEEAFMKEIKQKPNSAEGYYWLGHVYAEKREYGQLKEAWAKAQDLGGKSTGEIDKYRVSYWGQAFNHGANTFKKAQTFQKAKQEERSRKLFEEAADAFDAAIALQPDSSAKYNAYVYHAFALMGTDKMDEARESLKKQIANNPTADAYSALGQLIVMEGNALKKEGKDGEAAAKYDEALTLLNRASTEFPDNAELSNELLNTYIAADRVAEAVEKFQNYADKNSDDASAQYAAGTAMLQINRFEEAAAYLQKSLEIEPENESALYNLCVAYLRQGIEIRDADESTDPDAEQHDYKSLIRNAVPHMQKLLELQPDNAANWDLAGKIYATIGMTKEAGEAYEKADELRK